MHIGDEPKKERGACVVLHSTVVHAYMPTGYGQAGWSIEKGDETVNRLFVARMKRSATRSRHSRPVGVPSSQGAYRLGLAGRRALGGNQPSGSDSGRNPWRRAKLSRVTGTPRVHEHGRTAQEAATTMDPCGGMSRGEKGRGLVDRHCGLRV